MIRTFAIIVILLALSGGTHRAAAAVPWCALDDPASGRGAAADSCPAIADPQTLPAQLALPLPCTGYLVLQKVVVDATNVLDQQTLYLGNAPVETAADDIVVIYNGPQKVPLAGGFLHGEGPRDSTRPETVDRLHGRAYYLAKYPLTDLQARRIRLIGTAGEDPPETACRDYLTSAAALRDRDVRPATRLSWFDAIDILRRYQDWLLAHDRAAIKAGKPPGLPWEQGSPAYLRLPTEAEWEFAARGRVALKEDVLTERTYRISDPQTGKARLADLAEIASLSTADNGDGEPPPVGRKLPNLLGLYDMIGNVDQMVLEPFRLTRPDELHGQAGGYILKGGNSFTSPGALGVAHRVEVPYFDLPGETRAPTTGVRPALSVPVFVAGGGPTAPGRQNLAFKAALAAARERLVASTDALRGQAAARVRQLNEDTSRQMPAQAELSAQLAAIQADLDRSNARLNEADKASQRDKLEGAVLMAYNIRVIGQSYTDELMSSWVVKKFADRVLSPKERNLYVDQLREREDLIASYETGIEKSFAYYIAVVDDLSRLSPADFNSAANTVQGSFSAQGLVQYGPFQEMVLRHVRQRAGAGRPLSIEERKRWLAELDIRRGDREMVRKRLK